MKTICLSLFLLVIHLLLVSTRPPVTKNDAFQRLMRICSAKFDMTCPKRDDKSYRRFPLRRQDPSTTTTSTTTQRPLLIKFTSFTQLNEFTSPYAFERKHNYDIIPYSEYTMTVPVFQKYIEFGVKTNNNPHIFLLSGFSTLEVKVLLRSVFQEAIGQTFNFDGLYNVIQDMKSKDNIFMKDDVGYNAFKLKKGVYRWLRIEWKWDGKNMTISVFPKDKENDAINGKKVGMKLNISREIEVDSVGFGTFPGYGATYQTYLQYPVTDQKYQPPTDDSLHQIEYVANDNKHLDAPIAHAGKGELATRNWDDL